VNKRKIAVILVDRANYGRMQPVMQALRNEPSLEMSVICSGSMLLERFGRAVDTVRKDGFTVDSEIYIEIEGSIPTTMAKSVGFAVIEFASEFQRIKPDIVLMIGDRYEAFAAATAASFMNLCIAHIQGGEVSGSIDESTRHCITKLAHYHFPATKRSADYIVRMGEDPSTVFTVGCPSGDIALSLDQGVPSELLTDTGVGGEIDLSKPYLLVLYHPVTTNFGQEAEETSQLLAALHELQMQTIWLWPNIDAGGDNVSKVLRKYREHNPAQWLRLFKNFSPTDFLKVMAHSACAIGNSSSFIRDSSFIGTPVVMVGDRQEGREIADNVLRVKPEKNAILQGIQHQLAHGAYASNRLYGEGDAGQKIAKTLTQIDPYVQKRLHYIHQVETLQPSLISSLV
jgi:UDP-hydrolysing UDP-N-acetyl-D-glucosamine 2-epimerase